MSKVDTNVPGQFGPEVAIAIFRGIGQVFFQENAITGGLFTLGIALSSPIMALGLVVGSALGTIVAFFLGFNLKLEVIAQRFPALAKAWKLDAFFQSRGVTAEQINACLGNIDNISKLEQGTNAAVEKYTIQGTPTFVINGQVAEGIATWGLLRDRLRTMGAR